MLDHRILLAVVTFGCGVLVAQSDWERRPQLGSQPTARAEHSLAQDLERNRVVLFGGRSNAGVVLADTWVWDGQAWLIQAPANTPPARRLAAMVWHPQRQRVVLFGGVDALGLALDDLWEWDGSDWTQPSRGPGPHPGPRSAAAVAAGTADSGLILFGGVDDHGVALGDTWRWDGAIWSQLSPLNSPSARFGHRMVGDDANARLVLGDQRGNSDTWAWDGADWTLAMNPSPPGTRARHSMCYDRGRARVVLHGGTDQVAYTLDDTWEWDGGSWRFCTPPTVPFAVVDAALAFDPVLERTLRFGGFDGNTAHDVTFSFGAIRAARVSVLGAGCLGSAGVPKLASLAYARPWLGDTFEQVVDQLPAQAPIALHIGFSRTNFGGASLPLSLGFLGMPGCTLWTSIDAIGVLVASGGQAFLPLTIPQSPALVGSRFFSQALVIDPPANASGVTASNALEFVIGAR